MKVLCYGDSNTFGYDPRALLGARYEPDDRWVDILADRTGWETVNGGQNGREIPRRSFELVSTLELIARHHPDLTVIMLGTNDLLQGADPETVAARMESFLRQLNTPVFLVAPPPFKRGVWVADEALIERSHLLGKAYKNLAHHLGLPFADAADWEIELIFDGVHFSEAGHHVFAKALIEALA